MDILMTKTDKSEKIFHLWLYYTLPIGNIKPVIYLAGVISDSLSQPEWIDVITCAVSRGGFIGGAVRQKDKRYKRHREKEWRQQD